jgi:hypothetical protein
MLKFKIFSIAGKEVKIAITPVTVEFGVFAIDTMEKSGLTTLIFALVPTVPITHTSSDLVLEI